MNKAKSVAISLISIIVILYIGFNQEQALNFTQYIERRQVWLEIAVGMHVGITAMFATYYLFKKDKSKFITFLICFGLDILTLLISSLIMAMNFERINLNNYKL